jgi:magnesium transporter
LQFIIQTTESCREIISSLVDLYISNNDLRMNAIMKRLTIVSTIFIPLTFLAGIWGMNFKMMPELDWQYGYGIAWSLMLLTAISTWLYMRKKDWF